MEKLEVDKDLLFLALAEGSLYDCIRPEKQDDREKLKENDSRDSFRADSKTIFFHDRVVALKRNTINESLDCFKKNLGERRSNNYAAKFIVAMTTNQTS